LILVGIGDLTVGSSGELGRRGRSGTGLRRAISQRLSIRLPAPRTALHLGPVPNSVPSTSAFVLYPLPDMLDKTLADRGYESIERVPCRKTNQK